MVSILSREMRKVDLLITLFPPILNQRAVEMRVEQDVVGLQKQGNPTRSEVVDAWNPLVFTGEWVRGE